MKHLSHSPDETKQIGYEFSKCLKKGDVVALRGELGAGKTTFAKGVARGLGVKSERAVSSPTFVLIHEYEGKIPVYHLDWYRLSKVEGVDEEFARECFENGVSLVEWPERGLDVLPASRYEVRIMQKGERERWIETVKIKP